MASKVMVIKNIKIIGFTFNGGLILHAEDDICDFFKDTNVIKRNLKTGERYFIVNIEKNELKNFIDDPHSIYKGIFNGDNITVELFSIKVSQSRGFVYKLYYLSSEIPDISNNIKYQIVGEPTEDEKKAAANKIWNICKESPAMGNAVMDLIGDDAYLNVIKCKED